MAIAVISRAEAKAQGLKRYFTGRPCKHGHIAERAVSGKCCIVCRDQRKAQWQRDNGDAARTHTRDWMRKWRERVGSEHVRERLREAYRNDPERYRAHARRSGRKNYLAHPEKFRAKAGKRRAKEKGAGGTHTAADLKAIIAKQNHRCVYCRADLRKVKRHLDHIQPLARGGSNGPENLQFTCQPCNGSKGAKDPIQFAQELGRLL